MAPLDCGIVTNNCGALSKDKNKLMLLFVTNKEKSESNFLNFINLKVYSCNYLRNGNMVVGCCSDGTMKCYDT